MATTTRARQRARASGVLWLAAMALALSAFGMKYRDEGRVDWTRVGVVVFCAAAAVHAFARQPGARDEAAGAADGDAR